MLKCKACNIYIWDILSISCNSPNVHTYKTKRKKRQCVANTTDITSNLLHSACNTGKCLAILFRLRRMFTLKVGIPLQCTIYLLRA